MAAAICNNVHYGTWQLAINLCGVISLQAWYRGNNPIATVKKILWDAWTLGCCIHPASNMVVYACLVIYRVLCLNTFSFMWNSFLIRRQKVCSRELTTNEWHLAASLYFLAHRGNCYHMPPATCDSDLPVLISTFVYRRPLKGLLKTFKSPVEGL